MAPPATSAKFSHGMMQTLATRVGGTRGIDPDASVFCEILIRVSVVRSLLLLPRRCPKMGYSALFQRDDVYA
jgi:hypothetical protein